MNRKYKSVHDAHCCKSHGCKYGDEYCPVFDGDEEGVKCEYCYWDENDPATIELKAVKQQRDELLAALKHARATFELAYAAAEKHFNDETLLHTGHGGAMADKAIAKAEGLQDKEV